MSATPRCLPKLVFDWTDPAIREIAENIWHAQQAGWPRILTYDADRDAVLRRQGRTRKRRIALATAGEEVPRILSRDEYPFACTREHAGPVWVGHVPAAQNSLQGGLVSAFLGRHAATDGFRFEVAVVNRPPTP